MPLTENAVKTGLISEQKELKDKITAIECEILKRVAEEEALNGLD